MGSQCGHVPSKLNTVIQPLMAGLRREADAVVRDAVAAAVAQLVALCADRTPSPNDRWDVSSTQLSATEASVSIVCVWSHPMQQPFIAMHADQTLQPPTGLLGSTSHAILPGCPACCCPLQSLRSRFSLRVVAAGLSRI